ncbi:MAG: NAD-dependent DNA ligase LigA [Bacteroidales bacterium]|nr:NAD-dependent DNA ligase LigA [Candidatus Cryptobacteroides caccocaballi]
METEQIQKRIDELKKLISENNEHYYIENAPVISDYEFDMLMQELASIEKAHPELITPDSPTQRVGSDLSNARKGSRKASKEFEQYPHRYPMLSLGNTYSVTEIEEFADRAAKAIGDAFTYCCELKFDGTAICLTYRDGKLFRALTRGDGSVGDDVTENVKRIPNIPQRLNGIGWPKDFEIRGEIYMPYKAFDRLNEERRRDEEAPFANPRNAASGSLKLTDPDEVANRGLECTLYHILGEDLHFKTHDQALRCAMKWGLPVSDKRKICRNIVEIVEYVKYWDTERKFLPFATDGIVIKVNELPYQDSLGYTSKAPRWAVAYKFKAEQALSKVLSIDYQVGRTGAVTPVANLEPAQLSSTVVKRASLHNSDQMEVLDIRVGDYVYVEKGGEIIPKITGVELSKRDGFCVKPDFPTVCPDCGARLVRDEGEAKWFCPNVDGCPTQIKGKLVHFLSRKAMNVIAGDATIEQMYNKGYVRNVADFYKLDENKLLHLDGWKEKSAQRFLASLEESRNVPFEKVLFALGIRHVGETTAKQIARAFGSMDAIMNAGREQFLAVGDVGDVIADSIIAWTSVPRHREIVERLREAGLKLKVDGLVEKVSDVLAGQTVVVTGNFSISRDAVKKLVEANGGKNGASVSKKTSFILAGSKPGPEKIRKADELGIRIVTEEEFLSMIPEQEVIMDDNSSEPKTTAEIPVQGNLFGW